MPTRPPSTIPAIAPFETVVPANVVVVELVLEGELVFVVVAED